MILIFSSLIFASCSENELNESPQTLQNHIQTKSSYIINENPFNYVGEEHNNILLDVGYEMQNTFDEMIARTSITSSYLDSVSQEGIAKSIEVITEHNNISKDSVAYYVNKELIGLSTRDIINNPNGIDLQIQSIYKESNGDMDKLMDDVCALESTLVKDYNGGKEEVKNDLITITVLKYSLIFWNDAYANSYNPWNKFFHAAYVNKELKYITSKNILDAICNGFKSAANWVAGNCSNLVSCVGEVAIFDAAGAGTLIECGPVIAGAGAAVSSVLGGIHGWRNPWW